MGGEKKTLEKYLLETAFFLPAPEELEAISVLNETQRAAMAYVVSQARKLSENAEPVLEKRIQNLGSYPEDALPK